MRMHVSVVCVCVWKMHNCSFKWKLFTHWTLIYLMLLQQKQQQEQLAMAATCTHTHTYANVNTCAYVCVVYVGLLISFLLGYVLCEITQVQPTVIFVEVCFVSVPKAIFYCLSLSISLYPPLLHFLIIVFIVFTLSYACKYFSLLHLIVINIFQHFLYLPWHFIAFLHISFICSIM